MYPGCQRPAESDGVCRSRHEKPFDEITPMKAYETWCERQRVKPIQLRLRRERQIGTGQP